ncbi:MAG TPA: FtsX-like permease family protein [Chitinophagaceae bacterium]|nr:FtsX-like permease family protein [Chitinophagaceae bacterium]
MFKNYLKTALRHLWKNKTSSAINVVGLTVGLTCCLLIALYIQNELSYDNFEKNGKRIARVIMEYQFAGSSASTKGNFTSVRVAPVLKRNFPEIESSIKMAEYERVVRYKEKMVNEKKFMYADSTFFDIFSLRLLKGNSHSALAGPHKVVVTESTAKKYFGDEDPIGKMLQVSSDTDPYQVTGLIKDCPTNSQITFDFLASFSSLGIPKDAESTYWDANYVTYFLLKNEASITGLQAKLPAFMKKEMAGQGATINMFLEPFNKIHLYSPYDAFEPNNSITYIYILAAVALLILIIVGSTYINLSTARSLERAREVGVRKVIGARKYHLFWQFIGESALLCLFSVIFSLVISILLMPAFNQLTGKQLQVTSLLTLPFLLFSFLVAIGISLLAGSYPAFILVNFQPVKVLKGAFKSTGSGQWLRRSLIVFQFVISVFLIISTLSIQKQLYFIQHKKLGYDREHVLVLPMNDKMLANIDVIKEEFKSNPEVISVSRCVRSPVEGGGGYNMRSATMPEDQQINVTANPIDEDFIQTVSLQIIAGSDLTSQDVKDATFDRDKNVYHFILNESAVKQLGWSPQEAVNKKMYMGSRAGFVRGVVKDFHFETLRDPIKPFVLFNEVRGRELLVKLTGQHLQQTISFLESKWKNLVPDRPFEYRFLDDDYNKLYNAEIRLGKIMDLFSGIAILLACLGLFGLSSYAAQQRIKEIGIRKVLGASARTIAIALSKDFVGLAIVAIAIALPIAWWATNKWLQDFSYRTDINWSIYVAAGLVTILLSVITVAFQAIKAAMANPVKSLRTE